MDDCTIFLRFRPCSVANFGVTADGVGVDIRASSVLSAPPRNLFCDLSVPVVSSAAAAGPGASGAASSVHADSSHQSSADGGGSSANNWWQWTIRKFMPGDSHHSSSAVKSESVSTVALVDSGECLFEDKAGNSAKSGAHGVIIRNSEVSVGLCWVARRDDCNSFVGWFVLNHVCLFIQDAVFIMAGKRDVEATGAPQQETTGRDHRGYSILFVFATPDQLPPYYGM